jgi:hypothetical protein
MAFETQLPKAAVIIMTGSIAGAMRKHDWRSSLPRFEYTIESPKG